VRSIDESRYARSRGGIIVPRHLAPESPLVPAHHVGMPPRSTPARHLTADIEDLAAIAARHRMRGSMQGWKETLAYQRAAGTLFNTYTVAKSVIAPDALWDMPRNWLTIGRQLEIIVTGGISNIVTTPGLMNFQAKIGGVAAFDTGNIQLNATAHTTLPFYMYLLLTCRSIGSGAAATLLGLAECTGIMFTRTAAQTDDAQGMQTILAPQTAPAVGTGFDSTIANLVDLWVGFTISNAGNGIQIHQYQLVAVN
jgi:hypothetical protein